MAAVNAFANCPPVVAATPSWYVKRTTVEDFFEAATADYKLYNNKTRYVRPGCCPAEGRFNYRFLCKVKSLCTGLKTMKNDARWTTLSVPMLPCVHILHLVCKENIQNVRKRLFYALYDDEFAIERWETVLDLSSCVPPTNRVNLTKKDLTVTIPAAHYEQK